jgi:protein gp37
VAPAPQHQFQVLTKRPRRLRRLPASQKFVDAVWTEMERLSENDAVPPAGPVREDVRKRVANWSALSFWPLPNVWIGTSIESDEYCWRADELRGIPATVRFLSLEPQLGPVPSLELSRIDWVIVGGESGPAHRPLDLAWSVTFEPGWPVKLTLPVATTCSADAVRCPAVQRFSDALGEGCRSARMSDHQTPAGCRLL